MVGAKRRYGGTGRGENSFRIGPLLEKLKRYPVNLTRLSSSFLRRAWRAVFGERRQVVVAVYGDLCGEYSS
jgi:hypothetical protein